MSSDYYTLLTKVAQQLSKDDLEKLVFSCGNILPPSSAEKITSGIDLFRELKQRGHLGPANYDYLGKQLVVVGRYDLASMLPDKVEILYGESKIRDRMHFGCVLSPTAPAVFPMHLSKLKLCHPNKDSRIFLMHISQQLRSQDSKHLAFLMYPTRSHTTAIELAELLEREGGMHSVDVVNKFASCLEAVGRYDLAELVNVLTAPHKLLPSLSTSQQQLTLKMNLLLYSKHQHYDFYMRALHEAESDSEVITKLLVRPEKLNEFTDPSKIDSLAKDIQTGLHKNHTIVFSSSNNDPNSLVKTSLLEALKVNQAYIRRTALLNNKKEPTIEELCDLTEQVHESFKSFSTLMETLNWNSAARSELKETVELHRSPYGTPAELACRYILDISQEICQCDTLGQEMQKTDQHLLALNSIYYSSGYHLITIQWLACLLHFYTSSLCSELNLHKHTDTLRCIIEQKKDEIVESYSNIAEIVGSDILQKLIPLQSSQATNTPITWRHKTPLAFWFNVLLIELLVVAIFGRETVGECDLSFMQIDDKLCNQLSHEASFWLRVIAGTQKKEVELFRDKVLSGDRLCSRVIAKLTCNPDCY